MIDKNKVFFTIFTFILMSSCVTGPRYRYVKNYETYTSGFDVKIDISNITEDEFNYFVGQMEKKSSYQILESNISGNNANFIFHVNNLTILSKLQSDISNLKVIYSDSEIMQNMFEYKNYYKQYVFSKDIAAGSGAKYSIQVIFSPNSSVNIGGYETYTNKDGIAIFNGVGLNLEQAVEGIIFIIDSRGNKVKASKFSDGKWYIKALGENLGKQEEQNIELEALK